MRRAVVQIRQRVVVGLVEGKQSQWMTLVNFFLCFVVTYEKLSIVVYVVI